MSVMNGMNVFVLYEVVIRLIRTEFIWYQGRRLLISGWIAHRCHQRLYIAHFGQKPRDICRKIYHRTDKKAYRVVGIFWISQLLLMFFTEQWLTLFGFIWPNKMLQCWLIKFWSWTLNNIVMNKKLYILVWIFCCDMTSKIYFVYFQILFLKYIFYNSFRCIL